MSFKRAFHVNVDQPSKKKPPKTELKQNKNTLCRFCLHSGRYFTEATEAIASMPLVIAVVPLKCSSRNLQFPHGVLFTKEKMPVCPCPFKN